MLLAAKVVLIVQDADKAGTELSSRIREVRPATSETVPEGKDANGYLVAKGNDALFKWVLDAAKRARANATAQNVSKGASLETSLTVSETSLNKSETMRDDSHKCPVNAPTERDGLYPVADITTPQTVKAVTYSSPLACLMSFYAGIRLLAYADGRVIVRDPQGRESLAQYVKAREAEIWQEMAGTSKTKALSLQADSLETDKGAAA